LKPACYSSIDTFKNNPSVLGYIVEQICLSTISSKGLIVAEKHYMPQTTEIFQGSSLSFGNTLNTSEPTCALFIPLLYNFPSIDALILDVTMNREGKAAHLIPIQVTIAKKHKDSLWDFRKSFGDLKKQLSGYAEIKATFVWIVEEGRAYVVGEPPSMKTRSPIESIVTATIPVGGVSKILGTQLAAARS
jgi:hypothetical protein